MRDSQKNQQWIWYALRNVSASQDEWGNTKDVTSYSEPQRMKINVSANKGEAQAQAFGADLKYDREMVTHDMKCPIDEYSRLWIDDAPTTSEKIQTVYGEGDTLYITTDGSVVKANEDNISILGIKSHNYEVAAVSKSLNCIRYAIRRVNVSK